MFGLPIHAALIFNDAGELADFQSDDRYQTSVGGKNVLTPWSTPIGGYRLFGETRLSSHGEARWRDAAGDYPYIELTIDDVRYNVLNQSR